MHSIRSDVEPVDPSLVPLFISELDITQYTEVAILTFLVYDTSKFRISVDMEDWMTILLIDCNVSLIITFIYSSHTNCLTDILLMRVLALYHQDKRLSVCLRILFGLEAAFGLGILIYSMIYGEIVVLELSKGITICGTNRNPPKVWSSLSWLVLVAAPMLYGIILMVLALYKAAEHWRETGGFSQFPLFQVLIQDQAIYFIMVIFVSVMDIMANQLFIPNALLARLLTILGNTSLLCVLGSHLLVHLKEAGERGVNGGTSYRMKTMSSIRFS
ncbi:hypothetical protein DFH11DRAFT_1519336 [Phellopilus nigrolimitatus]|nr:hypothetical protein DFH11DRAFT_1519336 [Phellopilus nigrolimitatus]